MIRFARTMLAVAVAVTGCHKDEPPPPTPVASEDAAVALAESPPPSGPRGTLQVSVRLEGTPPEMKPLRRGSDPFCARTDMNQETVVVGDAGALENVVVRLKPGTATGRAPNKPVVVNQTDCMYRPRVQVATVGQVLEFKNPDDTLHNVHARHLEQQQRRGTETLFNRAQPANAPALKQNLTKPEIIELGCDLHRWMRGYVVVSDHPYAAVTGTTGVATIENVPAGSHTLEIWHEFYGEKTTQVTVVDDETASLEVVFDAEKDRPEAP